MKLNESTKPKFRFLASKMFAYLLTSFLKVSQILRELYHEHELENILSSQNVKISLIFSNRETTIYGTHVNPLHREMTKADVYRFSVAGISNFLEFNTMKI